MGFQEMIYLILGLIVIVLIVTSVMGVKWGAMVKTWIPKLNTTTNDSYTDISGSDEVIEGVISSKTFDRETYSDSSKLEIAQIKERDVLLDKDISSLGDSFNDFRDKVDSFILKKVMESGAEFKDDLIDDFRRLESEVYKFDKTYSEYLFNKDRLKRGTGSKEISELSDEEYNELRRVWKEILSDLSSLEREFMAKFEV